MSEDVVLKLFRSFVRPQLEYCVHVLDTTFKKDIELIKGFQKSLLENFHLYSKLSTLEMVCERRS
jgi:hypothetical protein